MMNRVRILTLALSLCIASSAWAGESLMINHKDAKIRNGPATGYTILWKPRMYTPLEVLAKHSRWFAVRDVEGDVGWIHDSVILKKPSLIVTSDLVNVRRSPESKAQVLFQAPKNYTFKVLTTKKGWYKVEDTDKDIGWVEKKGVWDGKSKREKPKSAPKKAKKKKK